MHFKGAGQRSRSRRGTHAGPMWLCGHLQLNQLLHRAEGGGELALVLVLAHCKLAYGWSAYAEHSSWLCGAWRGMCKAGCIRIHQLPTARPAQCLSVRACMCLCLAAAVVGYGTPRCAAACQASTTEIPYLVPSLLQVWAPTTKYQMPGITRSKVLQLCRQAGIPCRELDFSLTQVDRSCRAEVQPPQFYACLSRS